MDSSVQIIFVMTAAFCSLCDGIIYYHITEERDPKVLGNVGADANITDTASTTFRFVETGSQHLEKFNIESQSGILSTKAKLDREELCRFNKTCELKLRVAAVTTGITSVQWLEVRVVVDDINDNAPTFKQPTMTLDISEGSKSGNTFPIVGATDEDMVGNNSLRGYQLSSPSQTFRLVVGDEKPDGTLEVSLQLIEDIDREIKDSYKIYVIAKDGDSPPRTGMLTVDVRVTDINDNKPQFTKTRYEVTVEEDMAVSSNILQIKATDKDIGQNGEVRYRFSDRVGTDVTEYFSIDERSGNISLIRKLEYVQGGSYTFIVVAFDQGSPPNDNQSVVVVTVEDKNNNSPDININYLTPKDGEVMENSAVDTPIAHIQALDGDVGKNGEVTCSIDNPLFRMNPMAGNEFIIVVNGLLDREDQIEHVITIFCHDGGVPSLNNSITFGMQVTDENDNPPEFMNRVYNTKVSENTPAPALITKVSAMDSDQEMNAKVTYSLPEDAHSLFSIGAQSGIIESRVPFDRETVDRLEFRVFAADNGLTKRYTATATIILTITDQNDITPKFTQEVYEFDVYEHSLGFFGNVTATDDDLGENGQISYIIPPEYITMPFSISKRTGKLGTYREMDRERQDQYHFRVIARDNGSNSRENTAQVIVRVKDLNDNAPVMTFPNETNSSILLSYRAEPESLVTTIVAEDADIGENAEISFIIISGDDDGLFKLDRNSGEILLKREIKLFEIKMYTLDISLEDNGMPKQSTRHYINIQVHFVNSTVISEEVVVTSGNILIAIAIACITFVLSTAIIISICIIRRIDMKKRNYNSKSAEEMKIIQTMGRGSNRSSSSKGSRDEFLPPHHMLNRPNRKEVSFSLDDEQDSGFTFTVPPSLASSVPHSLTSSGMVTFKAGGSMMDDPSNKQLAPQQTSSHSRDGSNLSDNKQKQVHRMASLRVQQQLLMSQDGGGQSVWRKHPQLTEKKQLSVPRSHQEGHHDDNRSDLSGESTTSDSGRGGSDEDLRHAGISHPPELDHSGDSRHFSTTDSSGVSSLSYNSSAVNAGRPMFSTFGHSNNDTFPRNSNRNPVPQGGRSHSRPPRQGQRVQRLQSDNYPPHHKQFVDIPRAPSADLRSSRCSVNSDKNQRTNRLQSATPTFDDTLSESCATTNRDDDDVTTTSGSYTVNADDLCNEIDELFLKTDTVV
ncbi:protocadherin-11 X-linked-like [Mizuhopecten yessoensis]|uniref:protocadherin-11 X-linked-like n=1 Tax=Mizuhopecten yessoensis TaxID=6573 RepID=UPI000B459A7B|nr:protocadherin-11 X-linked-like [Mizuhopecten yessoensis]XP_021339000.1 protocadherin-11 X-linked-like [Mizuhopecten yessoensis]XP_021339001.1 protocadherin-11 X-linked-like [Mizuhopecten yessoensis]XP_021339002.1 protocadherin-11 X-linked-like [Mizuhopecten yessoensis]XP_021339003.1 protocadherin-11 X-linked-like [Mizuhopecten yessoensis]XP_021339004.1 protocadherin-11 X-linked-like [Mizuhopecten yessoensis]